MLDNQTERKKGFGERLKTYNNAHLRYINNGNN